LFFLCNILVQINQYDEKTLVYFIGGLSVDGLQE